jgi:hypothetical protein
MCTAHCFERRDKATEENAEPVSYEAPAPPDTQYDVKYYTGMLNSPLSADDRSQQVRAEDGVCRLRFLIACFCASVLIPIRLGPCLVTRSCLRTATG